MFTLSTGKALLVALTVDCSMAKVTALIALSRLDWKPLLARIGPSLKEKTVLDQLVSLLEVSKLKGKGSRFTTLRSQDLEDLNLVFSPYSCFSP